MTFSKVDKNQAEIVTALRNHGISVVSLAGARNGIPDLVCTTAALTGTCLLEVKGPSGKLTPAQVKWHSEWRGPLAVVHSPVEAFAAVGLYTCASRGDCQYHP